MRNKLSALKFHDKIFIAYGFVFLVMFGVVFGSTSFLIRLAFKREIADYVETLQGKISNNYQGLLNKVQKEVQAAAADERLHHVITRGVSSSPYQPTPEFDLFEYGSPDGKLLYPDLGGRRSTRTYRSLDTQEGHIELRSIPQQDDLGLQFVVQATEASEWGFITGGYDLQKWLETKTDIQSDEHPIFLVGTLQTSGTAGFGTESKVLEPEDWLPLNNAARQLPLDEWSQSFSDPKPQQEVFLQGAEETGGSTYTASRITPFRSVFATTREAPPVDLVIAYSHARQMRWQQQLTLILLLSGVVGLVLVYLISYIISRRITRPIAFLRQGVDHIAAGNLDHRVVIQSHNEIGQLAEGFNQMARDLKLSLEERMAAERAATWRDVARQVAHEIKNPLFPIQLSVENLQQAKSNPEVFEQIFSECTDTVIEEVDRIGKLIDEFHQFARMPKPQKKPSDLNSIVKSVLTLYTAGQGADLNKEDDIPAAISEQKDSAVSNPAGKLWRGNVSKIKVETALKSIPQLFLDPEQIAQALGNLLKNAIEAMPDGGTLTVKTDFVPESPQGNSDAEQEDPQNNENSGNGEEINPEAHGTVLLEIQDTGYGMSDETMENLFVPYYTTKSETDGTGLGVPIVRRIVAEHAAEIGFESAEGVGTTVRIHFPYNQGEQSEEVAMVPQDLMPLTRLKTKEETIDSQE